MRITAWSISNLDIGYMHFNHVGDRPQVVTSISVWQNAIIYILS